MPRRFTNLQRNWQQAKAGKNSSTYPWSTNAPASPVGGSDDLSRTSSSAGSSSAILAAIESLDTVQLRASTFPVRQDSFSWRNSLESKTMQPLAERSTRRLNLSN